MSRERKVYQLDRVLIAFVGLLSVISDGWLSDCLVMLCMLIWLWLPEWEKVLIKRYCKKNKKLHHVN